jgi:hypothetical protein
MYWSVGFGTLGLELAGTGNRIDDGQFYGRPPHILAQPGPRICA